MGSDPTQPGNGDIENIESFRELNDALNTVSTVNQALPVLKLLLRLAGGNPHQLENALNDVDIGNLRDQVNDITTLPDRFNDLFASEGWICYDTLPINMVKEAVEKAESGDFAAGEQAVLDYYTPDNIEQHLLWMAAADAFRPRAELAEKALKDYSEERYYSTVHLVLSITDGMVIDAHKEACGQPTGLFYGDPDLRAWDSMTAHIKGLERLKYVLNETRNDLNTDEIDKPFRHGIEHGRDLVYNNRVVAAKTWNTLFATREWVLKAENGELEEPETEELTLLEKFEEFRSSIEQLEEDKRRLREWDSRDESVGVEIPTQGEPSDYDEGSPERAFVEFLEWWQVKNWGYMRDMLRQSEGEVDIELLKAQFSDIDLQSFELLSIEDHPAASDIEVRLKLDMYGTEKAGIAKVRLIRENERGSAEISSYGEAEWCIYNWMPLLSPDFVPKE